MHRLLKYSALLCLLLASFVSGCKDDSSSDPTQLNNRNNKAAGELFLQQNRSAQGVVETASGLQYKVDTLGSGIVAGPLDTVRMSYRGMLVNGDEFTNTTAVLPVSDQIKGMQEVLTLLPQGSVFDVYIPYYLAYNTASNSFLNGNKIVSISAYSMLHFRVNLLQVRPYGY